MSELTEHQRSILEAVLLGLKIEVCMHIPDDGDVWEEAYNPLAWIDEESERLRIKPGQESKVTRLYGRPVGDGTQWQFINDRPRYQSHYIDIGPNGIVGGKLT